MKEKLKRILCAAIVICLCISLIPNVAISSEVASAGLSLSELRQKYPHGKYWNHANNPGSSSYVNNPNGYTSTPCTLHGGYIGTSQQTCNGFTGGGSAQLSWQCMGYAEQLGYLASGYNPRNNSNGWYTYTSSSALDNLKPGDIVRYKNGGHSIYVIGVNGDTVTYTDCNSDGHCIIRWDATISKSTLRSTFTHVRSAPSAAFQGSTSCSCSTSYAGTYICTTSTLNLTIRSGHGSSYSAIGSIPPGATVTVTKASGTSSSDWAHVEYNGVSGYASMEYLSKKQASQERDSRMWIWMSDSEMGDSINSIRTGEWLYLCYKLYDANTGELFDTYTTAGYTAKLTLYDPNGFATHTGTFTDDESWISIKRTTPGEYKGELVFTWDSGGTSTVTTYIDMVYEPRVTPSSSDVQLNVSGINSQTISISYSGATSSNSIYLDCTTSGNCFSYAWGSWSDNKMPLTITGVRAGQGTITIQLHDSDTDQIIATAKVDVTVVAPTYTVTYNANGGTGAPSSQTKYYGTAITLRTGMPTRTGYTFLGWSTSSTATTATYQPGGTFSTNANTTLYAVWRRDVYILSLNATYSPSISSGEVRYYTFTPTSTGIYVIYSNSDYDTKVSLLNASEVEIASDDDGGDGTDFRLAYTLTAGTKYYFAVKFYNSSQSGSLPFTFGRVYTITYNANGGSGAPSSQSKDYAANITLSSNRPTRTGYTFLGWSTSSTATTATYQPGGTFSSNANTTLYAVWRRDVYILSLNATYSPSISSGEVRYYTFTPTSTGIYVIYSNSDYDTKVSLLNASEVEIASDDDGGDGTDFRLAYTLTAGTKYYFAVKFYNSSQSGSLPFTFGWVYTITYNANGGSGAPSSQSKDYAANITLSSTRPTRTGYTFLGWSANSSATTATYQPGATLSTNASTTLYAVWARETYTVSYNANGGSGAPSAQTKQYGINIYISSVVPYRTGYTFLGWSTSSTATSATYQPGGTFSTNANTTLYAVWARETYTISYNANGGSGAPSAQTKQYGVSITIPTAVPYRTGYTFLGWSTSSSATSATYQPGATFSTNANTTLYAVWARETYTISYNANGGSGAPSAQTKQYGVSITIPTAVPYRTGYTFLGWSTSSTATTATYQPGATFSSNANTTLYAVWKKSALLGDVNGDGLINPFDASLILRLDAMLISADSINLAAADVSGDGKVDPFDASLILRYDAMLISTFPAER